MPRKINGKSVERGLYLKGNYLWVRVYQDGNEVKKYIGPISEAGIVDKAHVELHRMRDEIRAGKLGQEIKFVRWTVEKACLLYEDREASKLKGAGVKTYLKRIKEFFGHMFLDSVTFQTVEDFRAWLAKERGCHSLNINRHQEYVTRLFNVVKMWKRRKVVPNVKLPEENPGALVGSAQEIGRTRVLSPAEFDRLLTHSTPRVKRILTMAMHTLLRCKDLKGLTYGNVNEELNRLQGQQAKTGGGFNLPINKAVRGLIDSREGETLLDFTNFREEFTEAKASAKMGDLMMTDIRRTGAYTMHKNGVPIAVVSKMLGHTSIEMTMRYLPALDEDKAAASAVLDDVFGPSVISMDQIKAAM